jgi:hypothetical protein
MNLYRVVIFVNLEIEREHEISACVILQQRLYDVYPLTVA